MWRTEVGYEHKLLMGGVVEVFTREGEFVGSNPRCRVARDFTRKMRDLRARDMWLTVEGLPSLKEIVFFLPGFVNL